jgi:hypothetical protein
MNLWVKEISSNPIEEVKNILKNYEEKTHILILNGNWRVLEPFSCIQYLLFHNPYKHREVIEYLLDKGVDLNFKCKKGVNFYQLFILLFFYNREFQEENVVNLFIQLLNYGIDINNPIIFSATNVYTILDILQELQNKSVVPKNFFPRNFKMEYNPLPKETFEKIYLTLLCYGGRFFRINPKNYINTVNIYDCKYFLEQSMFKQFLIEKFKLPLHLSNEEIEKRILYLSLYKKFVLEYFSKQTSETPIQKCNEFNQPFDTDIQYLNLELAPNSCLQKYEFLSPHNKVSFHKSFFPILCQNNIDPFTRKELTSCQLQQWKNEMKYLYNFPISTIEDTFKENVPYIFQNIKIREKQFKDNHLISFLEQFFKINHPYQQLSKIVYFKKYEIKYFSHIIYNETTLFKKFRMTYENPNLKDFIKIIFYYCKLDMKFVNILYFLMEEILSDLKCFEELKEYIDKFDENPVIVYNQYQARFGTNNPYYINKFLQNMVLIYKFSKE